MREFTSVNVGAEFHATAQDGPLLEPPPPGQEKSWLDRMQQRVGEWMHEWESRTGAAKERLRERLLNVVTSVRDAAGNVLEADLNPWNVWERTLNTGAAKEFAGGIGRALGIGLLIVGAVLALRGSGKGR